MNRFYCGQSIRNINGLFGRIIRIFYTQHKDGTPFIEYLVGIENLDSDIIALDYWMSNEMVALEI